MAKRGRAVNIEILPTAKADLNDIYQYIAKNSVKYAKIEKQLIIEAIDQLYSFPNSGAPFNYKNIEARRLIFKNYTIIYRYKTEDLFEILTIRHHSRLLSNNPALKDEE
ncbi:type II toxin-antitoxin system RelE/ParE family toxin [uncultured Mucilaginibacter sp.]|uniref:type II toxin-antitoxin system RelE/ParE family toxin n=1 Tax=uncultured Mucilaginibacter sp. TaxID=797541 RepID=UPI002636F506|nr:type II toxin-antitoxin system RelE/ParE family toxin [uncultured Mucilaginibacter sp.]